MTKETSSDIYVFVQSFQSKLYSCHSRDGFNDDPIFETNNDNEFFEKIFRIAIEGDFYLE
jgi:hypothetical protein